MSTLLDYNLKQAMHFLSDKDRWNVLTVLILHTNNRNRCWPSTDTLARQGTHGNRKQAVNAKKWLEEHGAFQLVPYKKRCDEEQNLPQRQHVYELTGYIQACHNPTCDCGGDGRRYSYLRHKPEAKSFEAESFEAETFNGETFEAKTFNGETLSMSISTPSLLSQSNESLSTQSVEKRVGVLLAQIKGANIRFSGEQFTSRRILIREALNTYSYSTIRQAIRDSEDEGAKWWSYVSNKLEAQRPVVLTGEDYITGAFADYIDH